MCRQKANSATKSDYSFKSSSKWPIFVRFTQNTSIQEEVAERLRNIYQEAGFQFVYYDGAEDVPPPYWFNVSRAQWIVQQRLQPQALFADNDYALGMIVEGVSKSRFWPSTAIFSIPTSNHEVEWAHEQGT